MKLSFEVWRARVDLAVKNLTNERISSQNLVNIDYFIYYAKGWTPLKAAKEAIRYGKEY